MAEWISIRDALPGLHEKVLFHPRCNENAIYIGELNAVGEYGTAYFAVRSGRYKTCYSGSHWMRLPELPKEDADEEQTADDFIDKFLKEDAKDDNHNV